MPLVERIDIELHAETQPLKQELSIRKIGVRLRFGSCSGVFRYFVLMLWLCSRRGPRCTLLEGKVNSAMCFNTSLVASNKSSLNLGFTVLLACRLRMLSCSGRTAARCRANVLSKRLAKHIDDWRFYGQEILASQTNGGISWIRLGLIVGFLSLSIARWTRCCLLLAGRYSVGTLVPYVYCECPLALSARLWRLCGDFRKQQDVPLEVRSLNTAIYLDDRLNVMRLHRHIWGEAVS